MFIKIVLCINVQGAAVCFVVVVVVVGQHKDEQLEIFVASLSASSIFTRLLFIMVLQVGVKI